MSPALRALLRKEWHALAGAPFPAVHPGRAVVFLLLLGLGAAIGAVFGPVFLVLVAAAADMMAYFAARDAWPYTATAQVPYELLFAQPMPRRCLLVPKMVVACAIALVLGIPGFLGYWAPASWAFVHNSRLVFNLPTPGAPALILAAAGLGAWGLGEGLWSGIQHDSGSSWAEVRRMAHTMVPTLAIMAISVPTWAAGTPRHEDWSNQSMLRLREAIGVDHLFAATGAAGLIAAGFYLRAAYRAIEEREVPE